MAPVSPAWVNVRERPFAAATAPINLAGAEGRLADREHAVKRKRGHGMCYAVRRSMPRRSSKAGVAYAAERLHDDATK